MRQVAAIMAGGRGERLWPRSRTNLPKQFLSLGSGPSFLEDAYARLAGMDAPPLITVLTAESTVDLVRAQLPQLPPAHVLGEPLSRDTAATAVLAAAMAEALAGGPAVLALVPADHAVFHPERYQADLALALAGAETYGCPVQLGVPPTRPETGYGYIECGRAVAPARWPALHVATRFVEKPDLETAGRYLADGRHLWNSGVCVCPTPVLLRGLAEADPLLAELARALVGIHPGSLPPTSLARLLQPIRPISLDYALLERAERVLVVESAMAWDDVGSWEALTRLHPHDARGNVGVGQAVLSETEQSVVYGTTPGRLVVTHGVRNLVVVDTPDSLLIADRRALGGLKRALQTVRDAGYTGHLDRLQTTEVTPLGPGCQVRFADQNLRVVSLPAGGALDAADLGDVGIRLVGGQARIEAGAGAVPVTRNRARPVPPGGRVVTAKGCVLALEAGHCASPRLEDPVVGEPHQLRVVDKPWGREIWWAVSEGYAGKRIEVRAGAALSLQYHTHKHETILFHEGRVRLLLNGQEREVGPGHVAVIPPGTTHRMTAITDAVLFEVSTPELDDVVRVEDRYGRVNDQDQPEAR